MANMEFLRVNQLNTTTMVTASTGTGTFANMYDRNTNLSYSTIGYTSNTSSLINIVFPGPTIISNLILLNHNFRAYRAFYNSLTANAFTPAINVSANSQSSSYFLFASVTVSSIQLQVDTPMSADIERRLGEFILTERRLQWTVNPAYDNYRPVTRRAKVLHKMPDGGTTVFNIKNKYDYKIKLEYISSTFRNNLQTVWNEAAPLVFLPFPTTGSDWDGQCPEVIWPSDFDFRHGENSKTQGFIGDIELMETPSA